MSHTHSGERQGWTVSPKSGLEVFPMPLTSVRLSEKKNLLAECFYFTTSLCFFLSCLFFSFICNQNRSKTLESPLNSISKIVFCQRAENIQTYSSDTAVQLCRRTHSAANISSVLTFSLLHQVHPSLSEWKKNIFAAISRCLVRLRRDASSATQQFPFCIQP